MFTLREEIAKERFLDICAVTRSNDVKQIARIAVEQADALVEALGSGLVPKRPEYKGCVSCFGSGGKRHQPCRDCKGTGKVKVI